MSVRINTNIEALNAQRNLATTGIQYAKSVEKLSSGLRINRAADDAAGLGISEKLRAQVKGLNQAGRNAQDGISMVQTAEGALNEVHSMLQRMRELAVQASNATVSSADMASVNTEITALQQEINRIGNATSFNGQLVLTGALSASQTGGTLSAGVAGTTKVDVSGAKASTTYTLTSTSATELTLSDGAGNSQKITTPGPAALSSATLNFGELGVSITVGSLAGTTGAAITTAFSGLTVITGAGGAANFQIGANNGQTMAVTFADARTATYAGFDSAITTFSGVKNNANAAALITVIDAAIASVSDIRGGLGAVQNRLEHTVASLGVASENLTASESRIRDLDVAAEMVNFTKTGILQQAGTAILAQANQAPQGILALLR
jgi:flagellin